MNNLQIVSLFINNIISVGSSVLLLYTDIGINRDIKELNIFLASIFSAVNIYTIYSNLKCDELGFPSNYRAVIEDDEDLPTNDFHKIISSQEEPMPTLDFLYDNDEELYEERI